MPQQINIGVWKKDLVRVFESAKIGPGVVALLQLMNLQLGQAHELIGAMSDDWYVQRSIAGWRKDYDAVNGRLGWYLARLKAILAETKDPSTRAIHMWADIARPILEGEYRQDIVKAFTDAGIFRGIVLRPDGSGKSFGDAFAAATLWNQAAASSDADAKLGTGWATNVVRSWLTQTAHQLEISAPGEDPTIADATITTLQKLAEAPGAILRAVGVSPTLVLVGVGVGVAVVLYLAAR